MNPDPITLEDYERIITLIYSPRTPPPPEYPKYFCDRDKIAKHGIRIVMGDSDTWIISDSELLRAKAVGAIWWEASTETKSNERKP